MCILSYYMPVYFPPPPILKTKEDVVASPVLFSARLNLTVFSFLVEDSCSSTVLDRFITALHC